ncbi:MAG: ATP-dependent DNA ligase [Verrucomicrobia bacterium]|nr:ATP-dependent DNA ligase [Verrucomicrobiota bacterium]
MRAFAQLFAVLDRTPDASGKTAALEDYFRATPPADAAWALWFLYGQRLKRAVKSVDLRRWAAEAADLPPWLVGECCDHVGDPAEALALLLPLNPHPAPLPLALLVEQRLLPLAAATEVEQRAILRATWSELDPTQRFLWHKLLAGNPGIGVSRALLVRALARLARVEIAVMAHRLLGAWRPTPAHFARLMSGEAPGGEPACPYPFYLASPLEGEAPALGAVTDWQFEWKWDGLRAQLLRRAGEAILWSRDEEIVTAGFPEVADAARALPEGTVLDGELLAWGDGPLPFAGLQRRLNRRAPSAAIRRAVPAVFMAYDLLECGGADCRQWPLTKRRRELERLLTRAADEAARREAGLSQTGWLQPDLFDSQPVAPGLPAPLRLSPALSVATWDDLAGLQAQARATGAEGLMLKQRDAAYGAGRQPGAWWKWKVAPFICDAVLVAAQPGHGRRTTRFTDYTFAVWQGDELISVAKAGSGLTDAETDAIDAFVRAHTTGRFGPARLVTPELVFELAFDGVAPSTRHKAGFVLRRPRIVRWRQDKRPAEAGTVATLRGLCRG